MRISMTSIAVRNRLVLHSFLFSFGVLTASFLARFVETFVYVCFLTSLSTLMLYFVFNKTKVFQRLRIESRESRILHILVASLITFAFLTSFPLNIDRSFSVWMLSGIYQESEMNKVTTRNDLEKSAQSFFSSQSGEIKRRIEEQVTVGNIRIRSGGEVILTSQGKLSVLFFRFISQLFALNPKYVFRIEQKL